MAVPQFLVWERILVLLLGGAEGNHCCLTSGQPETYSPAALSDEGEEGDDRWQLGPFSHLMVDCGQQF